MVQIAQTSMPPGITEAKLLHHTSCWTVSVRNESKKVGREVHTA